jgi:hypothetical protein
VMIGACHLANRAAIGLNDKTNWICHMKKSHMFFIICGVSFFLCGCALPEKIKAKPYDNPDYGYVVYTPKSGYQEFDGIYLEGFYSSGGQYLKKCVATGPLEIANSGLPATIRYNKDDGVVYLRYPGGPTMASCDIAYDVIKRDAELYISKEKEARRVEFEQVEKEKIETKKWRAEHKREAATDDALKLFVTYCEALRDATGNASYIDDLRAMKHEFVGPKTNSMMYQYAVNVFHGTGGYVYCEMIVPQVKERIYTLSIDPTK